MLLGHNAVLHPVRMFVERCTDRIAERIEIGAFFEPAKDPGPGATRTRKRAVQCAENDHWHVAGRRLSAENLAYRKAVEIGQQQVEHNHLRRLTSGFTQRLHAGASPDYLESPPRQLELN